MLVITRDLRDRSKLLLQLCQVLTEVHVIHIPKFDHLSDLVELCYKDIVVVLECIKSDFSFSLVYLLGPLLLLFSDCSTVLNCSLLQLQRFVLKLCQADYLVHHLLT